MNVLHIRQDDPVDDFYAIRLSLRRVNQPQLEAEARIEFTFTDQEHEDLRWYLEDYLQRANATEAIIVHQVEALMKSRGEELYTKVLAANQRTQSIWFSVRNELADLRIEIASGVAEAASIPWELMRDPETDSPLSLRVKSFVRVQSDPNTSFVSVPESEDGRIRLLYIASRPGGARDVELRAVANRLLQDLGQDRARFDIKALRPPTFEQLQTELVDAKEAGRPYHIVHFDGHGVYADLSTSKFADWIGSLSSVTLGGVTSGKRGYVIFEHQSEDKMRPVNGQMLGQLLHDNGVPILVLNACQSAMHEAVAPPGSDISVHDEVRAIGSLAQGVIDEGVPAVLGMRYSVYVVTAAQYIGQLYAALAKGRGFGQAATEGRKHLKLNPDRWIGLQPRPLEDWFVPVVYEAAPLKLLAADRAPLLATVAETDPVQKNRSLLRHVPEEGFVGRDETLFALDRAFDNHRVVLLHAYAGQGKSSTAVEFARWYSTTGGLGKDPIVLLASFERYTDLDDLLNQVGQPFAPLLEAQGIYWSAINNPEQRRQLIINILRQFSILWIWDNVEPIAGFPEGTESQWPTDEQKNLRDFLQQLKLDTASKVKIVLTSRRDEKKWLGGIPHRIAMPRMRNSDAARLALKLGQEKKFGRSEISEWQPLLDYCAGNPLTLRVLIGQAVNMRLTGRGQIADFVKAIRSGEQHIEDVDAAEGRDKSLGASLSYGFHNTFNEAEHSVLALLHFFQGTVDIRVLRVMGTTIDNTLPELKNTTVENLTELLERAKDIGLLTRLAGTWFEIHPALPWFLGQLFSHHYDGKEGRSTELSALRSWVEAVSELGSHYHTQFINGNNAVLDLLVLEEPNLLQARRMAKQNEWWKDLILTMQGLRALYEYQGRLSEWARLVEEIRGEYCTEDDLPIPGREDGYGIMMNFRVNLARYQELNITKATALQEKTVEWSRQRARLYLALPSETALNAEQRNLLRTLAVSLEYLGSIQRVRQDPSCVDSYRQAIAIAQRIGDKTEEAIVAFNLGHAYKDLTDILDLHAAENWYQQSLGLRESHDKTARAKCIGQIGLVHYARFQKAVEDDADLLEIVRHAKAAEANYLQVLELCSDDDLAQVGPAHNQLGGLYMELGEFNKARYHLEQALQCAELREHRVFAGGARYNLARMYVTIARTQPQQEQQRLSLLRSKAYAEAALLDFRHYRGGAADQERMTVTLLDYIEQTLTNMVL